MSSSQEQAINQLRSDVLNLKKAVELVAEKADATQNELLSNLLVLTTAVGVMDEQTKARAREAFASVIANYPNAETEQPEFLKFASEIAEFVFSKRS